MKSSVLLITGLLGLAVASQAAQDSSTTSSLQFSKEEAYAPPQGFLPFIGLGGGYTGYDTSSLGSVEGTPSTIKLLGSWYFENPIVLDLGYGVNNQQFSQNTAARRAITDGSLELALRYAWDSRWQLGVIGNQLYNQGENYAATQADAHFAGLQLLKEFNMTPSWLARAGVRAQTLTNGPTNGSVNMYMIDLQFGWNPGGYKTSVSSAEAGYDQSPDMEMANTQEEMRRTPGRPVAMTPRSALEDISLASIAGTGSAIRFGNAQYAVAGADRTKVERIARALKDHPGLVASVEVNGYADATGPAEVNERISLARANSVKSIFERQGFTNVETFGRGSENSDGLSKNDRRAELVFKGVRNEEELKRVLSTIE